MRPSTYNIYGACCTRLMPCSGPLINMTLNTASQSSQRRKHSRAMPICALKSSYSAGCSILQCTLWSCHLTKKSDCSRFLMTYVDKLEWASPCGRRYLASYGAWQSAFLVATDFLACCKKASNTGTRDTYTSPKSCGISLRISNIWSGTWTSSQHIYQN